MTELKIAAVVLTLNRLDELKGCLAAMAVQTSAPDEIFVVDHGSTDGTREWLEAQRGVRLIYQENRGPGAGFVRGIREAIARGADWVWCVDDDAHPTPTALEELCRAMRARPEARIFNSLSVARTHPARFPLGVLWVRKDPENYFAKTAVTTVAALEPYLDANGIVDSAGGQFWQGTMLHRELLEHIGSPYAWFVIQGEEVEYGLRIMRAGYHILVVTRSVVLHPALPTVAVEFFGKTKSFRPFSAYKRYYSTRNGIWVHRMYHAGGSLAYAMRRCAGGLVTDLIFTPNLALRERLARANAAVRGAWDGVRCSIPNRTNVV